jgi:hypothetical protein
MPFRNAPVVPHSFGQRALRVGILFRSRFAVFRKRDRVTCPATSGYVRHIQWLCERYKAASQDDKKRVLCTHREYAERTPAET